MCQGEVSKFTIIRGSMDQERVTSMTNVYPAAEISKIRTTPSKTKGTDKNHYFINMLLFFFDFYFPGDLSTFSSYNSDFVAM